MLICVCVIVHTRVCHYARALMIVCAFACVCGCVRTICLTNALLEINKAIMCERLRRPIFLCSILTCVDVLLRYLTNI